MLNGEQNVKRLPNCRTVLRNQASGILLTLEDIDLFLEEMRAKGRVEGTLSWCRRGLYLHQALPENKSIQQDTLANWQVQLLAYADCCGYRSGPIFLTREGVPMSRANVSTGIWQLCVAAQALEEKGNPNACVSSIFPRGPESRPILPFW